MFSVAIGMTEGGAEDYDIRNCGENCHVLEMKEEPSTAN